MRAPALTRASAARSGWSCSRRGGARRGSTRLPLAAIHARSRASAPTRPTRRSRRRCGRAAAAVAQLVGVRATTGPSSTTPASTRTATCSSRSAWPARWPRGSRRRRCRRTTRPSLTAAMAPQAQAQTAPAAAFNAGSGRRWAGRAQPLAVISGGPGTGKTALLVGIVRAWARWARRRRIALAAPTGRAANRIAESLQAAGPVAPTRRCTACSASPRATPARAASTATTRTIPCPTAPSSSTRRRWSICPWNASCGRYAPTRGSCWSAMPISSLGRRGRRVPRTRTARRATHPATARIPAIRLARPCSGPRARSPGATSASCSIFLGGSRRRWVPLPASPPTATDRTRGAGWSRCS